MRKRQNWRDATVSNNPHKLQPRAGYHKVYRLLWQGEILLHHMHIGHTHQTRVYLLKGRAPGLRYLPVVPNCGTYVILIVCAKLAVTRREFYIVCDMREFVWFRVCERSSKLYQIYVGHGCKLHPANRVFTLSVLSVILITSYRLIIVIFSLLVVYYSLWFWFHYPYLSVAIAALVFNTARVIALCGANSLIVLRCRTDTYIN